ncbi:hypothetical protein A6302_00825 [Methylobrevis pamukkalensis]|uniref:DUF421 domain-containing protein n=2 Tax=Methylobrevis pamukkalensis TaxID=1439726 RepID=A0A1E3H639_9HYPH|nr:hypothetical protein A6302_00825 [Methylobrevis pamukkalensis]
MFFQDWEGIIRTIIVGLLAYVTLVIFLRISGKRTLAKLNAFDLVVTVALGSTLSAIVLQESVALAEGAAALALLILAQYAVTYTSVRSATFAAAVRSEPTLLARDGLFCEAAMRRERITRPEILSAIRSNGGHDIADVDALILESDAVSACPCADRGAARALASRDATTSVSSRAIARKTPGSRPAALLFVPGAPATVRPARSGRRHQSAVAPETPTRHSWPQCPLPVAAGHERFAGTTGYARPVSARRST